MSKRAVVALAVVVALLFAYVLAFERTSVTSKELSERAGRVLATFVRDKVDRLEVERKGVRMVLEKKPSKEGELTGWRMIEPQQVEADQDAVDQLLGELEWLSARRVLKDVPSSDVVRFGLDKPRYRVAYRVGGARHLLVVGHDDVHGDSVYARIEGEPEAYVVPKTLLATLDHEPLHYRDKRLFPELTVAWVRKLSLARANVTHALEKDDARWWLNDAPRGYADDKKLSDLLHALAELRAARHLEPAELSAAKTASESAPPSLTLTVALVPDESREDQSARSYTLALYGPCQGHEGERIAKAGDLLVCLREGDAKTLDVPAEELRDRRLFAATPTTVERFDLQRGEQKLSLMRSGEQWKQAGAAVDRTAVERWLEDLTAARALGVAPSEGFVERGSLTLWLTEGKRERVALSDVGRDGDVLVKRGDEPLVSRFPGSVFDRLAPVAGRFASPEVWSAVQPSQVARVEAQAEARTRTWLRKDGAWQATPSAAPAAADRMRELVRTLVDLRIRAYLTDQPRAAHGLDKSRTRARITLEDGRTLSLVIGAPTEHGAIARIDDAAIVEVERSAVGLVIELAGGPRFEPPAAAGEEHEEHDEEEHDEEEEHEGHAH